MHQNVAFPEVKYQHFLGRDTAFTLCRILVNNKIRVRAVFNSGKLYFFKLNFSRNFSASKDFVVCRGLRPPEPLLGLCPWTPLGTSVPVTP